MPNPSRRIDLIKRMGREKKMLALMMMIQSLILYYIISAAYSNGVSSMIHLKLHF
jgi:hypothetical protein